MEYVDSARSVSKRLLDITIAYAISELNFKNIATISSLIYASLLSGCIRASLPKIRDGS